MKMLISFIKDNKLKLAIILIIVIIEIIIANKFKNENELNEVNNISKNEIVEIQDN